MKKVYLIFCAFLMGVPAIAQTVLLPGGDMENWRSSHAGGGLGHTSVPVEAPVNWYGADSLFIGLGQSIGSLVLMTSDADWRRQLFKEDGIFHSGAHSAKVMTAYQDTLLVPGVLSNAVTHVGITFTPPYITGITYSGGTAVTLKPTSVSAWVQYFPGIDTFIHATGLDTGLLTVQVLSHINGYDSVIGRGVVAIPPCTSWTQVTANVIYPLDTTDIVDTIRVTFTSSGGGLTAPLDSSTLYVDDVALTGTPQITHEGVKNVGGTNEPVKIYPNPVTGTLYLSGPQTSSMNCTLFSVSGKSVLSRSFTGNGEIDVTNLPAGLYFYLISGTNGAELQRGKVNVTR